MNAEPFNQDQYHATNFAENKAHYKNMMVNNKRVIKTSRNLFNECAASTADQD